MSLKSGVYSTHRLNKKPLHETQNATQLDLGLLKIWVANFAIHISTQFRQESPAVADKPAQRLQKVCTVYVRAVGL